MRRLIAGLFGLWAGVALLACSSSPSAPSARSTRIAVSALHGPIRLSTLTGADERVLILGNVNAPDWSPKGDRLVYVDDRGSGNYALSTTDTLGNSKQLPVPLSSSWPQYSADGQWIYFVVNDLAQVGRIHPDGTGLIMLRPGTRPAPAPDNQRIAMSAGTGIWVGDPVTGVGGMVPNTTLAEAVRWSPDGNWIAYREYNGARIVVIHPDGTGKVSYPADYIGGVAWSPDSKKILAGSGANLQLIDRDSGTVSTLPVTGVYPAWRR